MDRESETTKVLIVDDNKENLDLLAYFLKPQNYQILTAMNGAEALEKVESEDPDIILLDIMLPKMDGFQVCERVKKNPDTMFIPIIMITALKELKDKIRSLEAGADDFISKPFESVELLTRVKSLLRIKKYQDELTIKNRQLKEQNRALERMDQFKDELSHLIVHDMKNPLFVIQGNLQMMNMGLNQNQSETVNKYLRRIERSTQNLSRMVHNLIDISKIEAGRMELSLESAYLNEILERSTNKIWDYPENKNRNIEVQLGEDLPINKIDTSVMERVFDNLISFATANVPEDGKIEIKTFKDESNIYFTIHDHGTKLPEKYQKQMFDKFNQLKIKNEGFRVVRGLGFTFCNLAVQAHGGQMWIDDQNKVGNRFIFSLPLKN
ncbi:MAG: response regulator [Caldithrix sp.]|nr:response regulator [Caldithrix sp.]